MDRTSKRLILLAVLFALLVGLGVYRFLASLENMSVVQYTEEVVIAIKDIPARTTVTFDMVEVERVPVGTRHEKAFTQIAQVIGQVTTQPIVAGEQTLSSRLFASAQQAGLSYQLATGFRALSVGINQRISVAYQVRPGDFVDIIVSYEPTQQTTESVIMLQNIQVLAMGQEMKAGTAAPTTAETITLAVRPEQAERLVWAEDYGRIRLILRPALDSQIVSTPGATTHSVDGR
jgi:pilus assembly protein CpaB